MKFSTDYEKYLKKALDSKRAIFFKGVNLTDAEETGEFNPEKLSVIKFSFSAPNTRSYIYTVNATYDSLDNESIVISTEDVPGPILGYDRTTPIGWWQGPADAIQHIKDDGTFADAVNTRQISLWFSTEPFDSTGIRKYEPAWNFPTGPQSAVRCAAYSGSVYSVTGA